MRVFVHGGVAARPKHVPDLTPCARRGLETATAVAAVENAVIALEDHPSLNAGYGATLNRDGRLELDAAISDGATGHHGGVVTVTVRNPIVLARRVLEETPHVIMAGAGALALGRDLALLEDTTPEQQERYRSAAREGRLRVEDFAAPEHVDTVGAVALDPSGRLAAGSSTGGVFGKLPGRVGDSAIPGAGTYACPAAAVVGTGVGEVFLETLASYRVARLIEEGVAPQEACERIVRLLASRRDVAAGLLALDREGRIGAAYRGETWAVAGATGRVETVRLA